MKACQKFDQAWVQARFGIAASLMLGAATSWAVDWTGGGDGTDWNDGANWDGGSVPIAVSAALGDVASGTRTVTVDSAVPTIASLAMTQTTAGATNALAVDDALVCTQTGEFFTQTRGPGVPVGGLVLNVGATGWIVSDRSEETSASNKSFTQAGTWNLNGGTLMFRNRATGSSQTVNNLGVLNSQGGSIVSTNGHSSTGGNGLFLFNNGSEAVTDAEFRINSGTTLVGRVQDGDRGLIRLSNYGAVRVANDAILRLNNRSETGGAFGTLYWYLENQAGSDFHVGHPTIAGSGQIWFTRDGSDNTGADYEYQINNAGTFAVYGESAVLNRLNVGNRMRRLYFTNAVGATLKFLGDASGILIGDEPVNEDNRTAVQITNSGTVTFGVFAGAASGVTRVGTFGTATNSRGSVIVTNDYGGLVTIEPDALLLQHSANAGSGTYDNKFINAAGGTAVFGSADQVGKGGTLQFAVGRSRTSGTSTKSPEFSNAGLATLHGTSAIERSTTITMKAGEGIFLVNNEAGGVLTLRDTARINNATRHMAFTNVGRIEKPNAGTAVIASGANGAFTNAGVVAVSGGGTLALQCAATFTADSTAEFDVSEGASVLEAGSTLMIEGGTLNVAGASEPVHTVITHAEGARTGVFDTVSAPGYAVRYDANAVRLIMPATVVIIL